MATYKLNESETFDATGIIEPRESWVETAEGKRERSGQQDRNQDGLLLWNVGTTRPVIEWGRVTEKLGVVTVAAAAKPQVKRHQRIRFKDLTLEVRATKDGKLVETFSASGIENG